MEFAGSGKAAEKSQQTFDRIGEWNDPNPSTQLIPEDIEAMSRQIRAIEDESNIHNPVHHINRQHNYKNPEIVDEILRTTGDSSNLEVFTFFNNTIASGEQNFEDALGNNPIFEDNRNEAKIRFSGTLNTLPLASLTTPPGTNIPVAIENTTWDKRPISLRGWDLDMPLTEIVPGVAPLRADTQISGKNTDTGDNPLLISQFLDRNQVFDEGRERKI